MPIVPTTTAPIFRTWLAANLINGQSANQLAKGLADGLFQYAQSSLKVVTADVGTLGVGRGIGQGFVVPTPFLQVTLLGFLAGRSVFGVTSPLLASAVSLGMTSAFALASVRTTHPTVGVGTGVTSLIPSGAAPFFVTAFRSAGMNGEGARNVATAIGNALDTTLPLVHGFVVIAGPPSPSPGAGIGTGTIT